MPSIMGENVTLKSIRTRPSLEGRLSSVHLTKEIPTVDSALEVYYRDGSAAVPFTWESRPGTPKIGSRDSPLLPPLTPPPSFQHSVSKKTSKKYPFVISKANPKTSLRLSPSTSTSASSTMSSPWSSHSVPSSPFRSPSGSKQGKLLSSPRMSMDSTSRDEYDQDSSPVSTLCFRTGRSRGGRSRGGCTFSIVKLLLREFA